MTRAQLFLVAAALAEENELADLKAARKTALQNLLSGGRRVTSWSDIGLSSSAQFDISFPDLAGLLSLAVKIKTGAINPAAASRKQFSFFAG